MYVAVLWLISIVNLVWLGDAQSISKFSVHICEGFVEIRWQGTDLMTKKWTLCVFFLPLKGCVASHVVLTIGGDYAFTEFVPHLILVVCVFP